MLGVCLERHGDLCSGLPLETVRLHKLIRLTWIIEASPQIVEQLLNENSQRKQLCENEWMFLATLNPETNRLHVYERGTFQRYTPQRRQLPELASSELWYRGLSEDLTFASIGRTGARRLLGT